MNYFLIEFSVKPSEEKLVKLIWRRWGLEMIYFRVSISFLSYISSKSQNSVNKFWIFFVKKNTKINKNEFFKCSETKILSARMKYIIYLLNWTNNFFFQVNSSKSLYVLSTIFQTKSGNIKEKFYNMYGKLMFICI